MTSTSPVSATPAVDSVQQNSFHPSWIRSAFNGGGTGTPVRGTKPPIDHSVAAPVFVKNRYGREDMLALMGDEAGYPAPEGLQNCPFYVEEALQPIVCYPLSDLEQRLQQNINSSKAMASLSHAERANLASGAYVGSDSGTAGHKGNAGGWTSVKQWNRNHSNTGSLMKGSGSPRTYAPCGRNGPRGDGTNTSQDHSQVMPFGQKFVNRGRGAPSSARGGGVSGTTFNSRAQGLYDPRDPKDRPRHRIRSTSDEGDVIGEGGWTASPSGKQGWSSHSKDAGNMWSSGQGSASSSVSEVPEECLRKSESGPMPEWMEDGEDQDRTGSGDDTTSATGSFDEHGRFQKKHHSPLDRMEERTPNVIRDGCVKQSATIENYGVVSSTEKSTASQQRSLESNSSLPQPHILNKETETSRGYSNVLSQAEAVGYHPSLSSQQSVAVTPAVVPSAIHQGTPKFFYLDPTKQERGPFEKIQMDSWYKRGYFTEGLEVRRHAEAKYRTLGELMQLNGQMTPFDFKDDIHTQPPVTSVFSNPAQSFAALFASGTGTMWSELSNPANMLYNQSEYDPIAVERKRIEDEQRRILEEQAKMREYQEHLLREMQKQREEQEKELMEQKLALLKHQEEIERRERELKESAEETKARLEMERLALAEKARLLEEERVLKIQQNLEEARKAEEKRAEEAEKQRLEEELEMRRKAEMMRLEEEVERWKAEGNVMRQQEVERERLVSREEGTRRISPAKAEKVCFQQVEQQRKQRAAEENARKSTAAPCEKEKFQESAKTFEIEEIWQAAPKPSVMAVQSNEGKDISSPQMLKSSSTKAAPWSAASSITPMKEKSLKEIQEEEERLLRAEQAQQARLRKEHESVNLQSIGTWSNASQRLQWTQPLQQSHVIKANVKPAWGGVGVEQQKASSSPMWDGPSLQAANKAPSAPSKKAATTPEKSKSKSPSAKSSTNSLSSEKAAKRALGMCEDNSLFLDWVVQRLKQLNPTVEADVLAMFIEGVENPDEVEDYVMGYLGDSKTVKDFVREFLQKRSDFRNRGQHVVKDDLSSARGAPLSGNGSGSFSTVQGKKKKNKSSRLIVDGSCLGFRATSDPNRVNQGEIETVGLTPGQKR